MPIDHWSIAIILAVMVEAVLLGFCMENLAAEKKTEFDLCLDSNIQ